MFFGWEGPERGWGRDGLLFEFEFEGEGGGVGVGANSRLGAYSNKYGNSFNTYLRLQQRKVIGLACREGSHA